MKPALLIIDVLQEFFDTGRLEEHRGNLVAYINELIDFAREKEIPIIWVRQEFKEDLSDAFLSMRKGNFKSCIENTPGAQILPELNQQDKDFVVIKKRYSAFFKTNLDEILENLNIDTLILAGVNTHACVRMAAIDGYQRDYEVILATDCIDSYDEEFHRVSLRYLSRSISILMNNQGIKDTINLTF